MPKHPYAPFPELRLHPAPQEGIQLEPVPVSSMYSLVGHVDNASRKYPQYASFLAILAGRSHFHQHQFTLDMAHRSDPTPSPHHSLFNCLMICSAPHLNLWSQWSCATSASSSAPLSAIQCCSRVRKTGLRRVTAHLPRFHQQRIICASISHAPASNKYLAQALTPGTIDKRFLSDRFEIQEHEPIFHGEGFLEGCFHILGRSIFMPTWRNSQRVYTKSGNAQ